MASIKSKNTKPEIFVRKFLHGLGFRFSLHKDNLPGKPDIYFRKYNLAMFVHGCFWHRHAGCPKAATPATRPEFWQAKFATNVARDRRVSAKLRREGWRVLTVWECQLAAPDRVAARLSRALVSKTSWGA